MDGRTSDVKALISVLADYEEQAFEYEVQYPHTHTHMCAHTLLLKIMMDTSDQNWVSLQMMAHWPGDARQVMFGFKRGKWVKTKPCCI